MKTIIYNAKAYIERETFAEAVLIEDGFISAVGSNEKIRFLVILCGKG